MTRRTLLVLPALVGLAAALSACGSFTRCQRETRTESEYVYAEQPRQDVDVQVQRSPCDRQVEVKRNPCDRLTTTTTR